MFNAAFTKYFWSRKPFNFINTHGTLMFCGPSFVSKSLHKQICQQPNESTWVSALNSRKIWKLYRLPDNVSIDPAVPKGVEWYLYRHSVGLYWVCGHVAVRGNDIAYELVRGESVLKFVGPEQALGVSRQDIRRRIRRWLVKTALGVVERSWWHPKTDSRIIFGTLSWCRGLPSVLLTGNNPGLLLAFSVNILPWWDIFTLRGCQTVHYAVGVGRGCRLCPHSLSMGNMGFTQTFIWAPSCWNQRTSRV